MKILPALNLIPRSNNAFKVRRGYRESQDFSSKRNIGSCTLFCPYGFRDPEIRINSESPEFFSNDMLQIVYAQDDFVHTYDTSIKSCETVFVLGAMDVSADHIPATLTLIGPDGETIYSPPLHLDERGQFKWLLHPPAGGFEIGTNQIVIAHPGSESTLQTEFEVTEEVQLASEMSRKI